MTTPRVADSRIRAYIQFMLAMLYFFFARSLARHGAQGLSSESWQPLVEQTMLVFLLLLGFAGFGFTLNRQVHPLSAQGLYRRPGFAVEAAQGIAVGWSAVFVCALVMAVFGGIAISLRFSSSSAKWLLADGAYFALMALAEEIAFRGYAFQRFARALGSAGALLGFAALYAFLQALTPGANHASVAVSVALSVLLSTAYLRTGALWVSWGINFAWKATRALVFGLAISGVNNHSPVVQGDPMGPFWLTGGGFGLEGSWLAFFVLLAALPVLFRVTRELNFRYNTPEIIPAGIAVDLDAAARRQHEAAMGPAEPVAPGLVQILPVAPPPPMSVELPSSISGKESP